MRDPWHHVPTPHEVAASGVHQPEQGCRPRGADDAAGEVVAELFAEFERRTRMPPVRLAAVIAEQVLLALAADSEVLRHFARLVAREAVREARRLREKGGGR